jgi:small basic protein (TIGR04137 family)
MAGAHKTNASIQTGNFDDKLLALPSKPVLYKRFSNQQRPMSQHNSFKVGSSAGKKKRNVLKRFERVDLLRKRGDWKEGDRVFGLRKTKPIL